jgi:NADH-quinone oxidoreductase subunit J
MVLFIFVIMLLNAGIERKSGRKLWGKYAGAPLLVVLIGLIAYFVQDVLPRGPGVNFGTFQHGNAYEIGMKLFQIYLLPFEVTSILILVAIIGAIVLARKEVR